MKRLRGKVMFQQNKKLIELIECILANWIVGIVLDYTYGGLWLSFIFLFFNWYHDLPNNKDKLVWNIVLTFPVILTILMLTGCNLQKDRSLDIKLLNNKIETVLK
jgi:RsiW-degrading membrane proteinase PrsW (M82 family)